jgi:hypothetical protein
VLQRLGDLVGVKHNAGLPPNYFKAIVSNPNRCHCYRNLSGFRHLVVIREKTQKPDVQRSECSAPPDET